MITTDDFFFIIIIIFKSKVAHITAVLFTFNQTKGDLRMI